MRAVPLLFAALILAGCVSSAPRPLPASVAILGDSISRGTNAASPGEQVELSWGARVADDLRAIDPLLGARVFNDAESGARMADLADQARAAVEQRADLVVLLMGANDACRRGGPTPVETFRAQLRAAAGVLRAGLPTATVLVLSIPDVARLRELANLTVIRARWQLFRACDGQLLNASAPLAATIDGYDAVLAEESARAGFLWDGGAVHAARFDGADLSTIDAFHPNAEGQKKLGGLVWATLPWSS